MVLDACYGWPDDHNREATIRVKNYIAFCGRSFLNLVVSTHAGVVRVTAGIVSRNKATTKETKQ